MMPHLPPHEGAASRHRYELARALAQCCPAGLGRAIAVTSSVSLGLADADSDIELLCWVDALPPADARLAWFVAAGATGVLLDGEPIADGSWWATCPYRGVWVEAGWQTVAAQDALLGAILAGEVADHERLILASIIAGALPLRGAELVGGWQRRLAHYPDAVQARLIAAATEVWRFPNLLAMRWALARRGDRLALVERLVGGAQDSLRVLFALNRQWEPEWKWLSVTTGQLARKPDRLIERIEAILTAPTLERGMALYLELARDTLALVPPPHDVAVARAAVAESLRLHPAGGPAPRPF